MTATNLALFLEVEPVNFTGVVTVYTLNCPKLSLSNYAHVNVTATGTNNTLVSLGFSMDDGSTFDAANLTDPAMLSATPFDLTSFAE